MRTFAASIILLSVTAAHAQPANPLSGGAAHTYDIIKRHITNAAAKMPEEHYPFKPTPDVRTFAQLIGHIADANFGLCAVAAGQKSPGGGVEKSKSAKADLVAALAESFAWCDRVHADMTDAAGAVLVKFTAGPPEARRPEEMPKLSVLEYKSHHAYEHYGNIVTYMRLKAIVPPSSERPGGQ